MGNFYNMQLQEFLKSLGISLSVEELILDDTPHQIEEVSFKGSYKGSNTPFGVSLFVYDWRTSTPHNFKEKNIAPVDQAQYATWEIEQEKKKAIFLKEELERHEITSKSLEKEWLEFSEVSKAPSYLNKKGVKAYGVKFRQSLVDAKSEDVIVPLRDINNKIYNFQIIQPDGSKNNRPTRMAGLFHWIGVRESKLIYVCEGYATGASIHEATNKPVVCAMTAGNLPTVAKLIKEKYPKSKVMIAGDNDRFNDINIGREKAIEASKLADHIYKVPIFQNIDLKPTDFNDLHQIEGLKEVEKQLTGSSLEKRDQFNFISFKDLLTEPENPLKWVVEDYFQEAGTSALVGPPKGGKTTLMRYLMSCVINGESFLEKKTKKGRVIYLALEEHRGECIKLFKNLGIKNPDNFILSFTLPEKKVERLIRIEKAIFEYNPTIIIIDTLFKFIQVQNTNDYTPIIEELRIYEALARDSGSHICFIHHTKKGATGDPIDGALGSHGITGSVDTAIGISNSTNSNDNSSLYKITTRSRYSPPIEPHELRFERSTGKCSIREIEPKSKVDTDELLSYLMLFKGTALTTPEITKHTQVHRTTITKRLEKLKSEGKVLESKGDNNGARAWSINPQWSGDVEEKDKF